MGFDIECILNIQSLLGEYFCPVCRLLVYPNEALQTQCTHLYCKPCLKYVEGTTRACPYDGYLVTEADSKPLIESNKTLAETIGKISVHCLYYRSGCTWQGPLYECTSHCSGCAFANYPVLCNRCGIQIMHRQVQEHSQNCPGAQPQLQHILGVQDTAATGTTAAVDQSQTASQSVTPTSQAQASKTATAPLLGHVLNQKTNANTQVQSVATVLTPEQWCQQQYQVYQQYYKQYPGYDPQQAYQHFYPHQQQAIQQHPQHVQGQHQPQVYTQPLPHQHVQALVVPQHQNQAQVNTQQQLHPEVQPQMQSQTHPPPHGHLHPGSYPQAQPHPQQPMQMSQIQLQPQHHSQVHTLPHSQPPSHSQAQVQHHSCPTSQLHPSQPNQPLNPNAETQTQHPLAPVIGHQSIPQPQSLQKMQLGAPQHHPMHILPQSGSLPQHAVQMPSQFPQQPPQMHPPQSLVPAQSQQQSAFLPSQGQVPIIPLPSVQQQPIHPHVLQPGHPVYQQPLMHALQQPVPQQYVHLQPFPGQASVPFQNQLHQQLPMEPQLCPQGPHHSVMSQQIVAHGVQPHPSQNNVGRPIMPNHGGHSYPFPQSQVGPIQLTANQPAANQNYLVRTNNHLQMPGEQQIVQAGLFSNSSVFERQGEQMSEKSVAVQEAGSLSQGIAKTDASGLSPGFRADSAEARTLKYVTDVKSMDDRQKKHVSGDHGTSQVSTLAKDTYSESQAAANVSAEPAVKSMMKKEHTEHDFKSLPAGKSIEIVAEEQKDVTNVPKQVDQQSFEKHSVKLPKDAVDAVMPVFTGTDNGLQAVPLASIHIPDSITQDVAPRGSSRTPLSGIDPSQHGYQERNSNQPQFTSQGPGVDQFRGFPPHGQVQGKGFGHPAPVALADQGRCQLLLTQYGPSSHQQRPGAPSIVQPVPLPGLLHQGQVQSQPPILLRPQGPRNLPLTGQPLNPPEHFPASVKQPHGSFHPKVALGGIPDPGPTLSFGRGPSHLEPPQRNFEMVSNVSQGKYNQGHAPFSQVGLPRITQGEPPVGGVQQVAVSSVSSDLYSGIMGRTMPHGPEGQFDVQKPNSHLRENSEEGPLGPPPGFESSVMGMNGPPGFDSMPVPGLQDDKPVPSSGDHFPMEPTRCFNQGDLGDLKQFPRHCRLDTDPVRKSGSYFSMSTPIDRHAHGFIVDAASRPLDKAPLGLNYDARERARMAGPDFNVGRMDISHTHSDFHGPIPGFGRDHLTRRSTGGENSGVPTHQVGGLSGVLHNKSGLDDIDGRESRPFGNSVHESMFPVLPSHLRRGELDGQDILPRLHLGERAGFGAFPGKAQIGELAGPGNFPHHLPLGESFGGKLIHPRLGDPGFRSSYTLQGFPTDSGFYQGGLDSFERKRKTVSMGWCRICKVDCETVEGLELHSQTLEHQKITMDMVLSIKQHNTKKHKTTKDHSSLGEASKLRSTGHEGRGSKP